MTKFFSAELSLETACKNIQCGTCSNSTQMTLSQIISESETQCNQSNRIHKQITLLSRFFLVNQKHTVHLVQFMHKWLLWINSFYGESKTCSTTRVRFTNKLLLLAKLLVWISLTNPPLNRIHQNGYNNWLTIDYFDYYDYFQWCLY